MTELPRLLDSKSHPEMRALLEAGLADSPTTGSARRAAVGLGLSAGALVTITSGVASGAAVGGTGLVVSGAAPSLLVIAGQWLAIGVLGGAGLVGGASYLSSDSAPAPARLAEPHSDLSPRAPSVRRASSQVAAGSDVTPPALDADNRAAFPSSVEQGSASVNGNGPAPAKNDAPQQVVARAFEAAASSSAFGESKETTSGRLGREVSLIDEARRALAVGDAPRAEATLDAYAALARTGTLDREAQILRVEALVASGQRAAAVVLARSYLQAYPSDPHAPMLRQLVTDGAAPKPETR